MGRQSTRGTFPNDVNTLSALRNMVNVSNGTIQGGSNAAESEKKKILFLFLEGRRVETFTAFLNLQIVLSYPAVMRTIRGLLTSGQNAPKDQELGLFNAPVVNLIIEQLQLQQEGDNEKYKMDQRLLLQSART